MTVGIAFVGCGFIANVHAGALTALAREGHADARLVACFDRDPARTGEFASRYGFAAHVRGLEEVLARDDVDAVYVCTPTVSHPEIVDSVAKAGKAIFCEKPLAFDAPLAHDMATTVERAGVVARVGLVLRFSPTMREIRRSTAAGGTLMAVVFRDDQFIPIRGHYGSTWRADRHQAGAGTVLEHSIHDVDILRWLCGDAVSVAAVTRNVAGHDGIEDVAVATISFRDGAAASLVSVWHDVDSRPSGRRVEVFCRDAAIATDYDVYGPVTVQTSTSTEVRDEGEAAALACDELGAPQGLARRANVWMLEDWAFCEAVAGRAVDGATFRDAVAAHAVVDAVYASAARGGVPVAVEGRAPSDGDPLPT